MLFNLLCYWLAACTTTMEQGGGAAAKVITLSMLIPDELRANGGGKKREIFNLIHERFSKLEAFFTIVLRYFA